MGKGASEVCDRREGRSDRREEDSFGCCTAEDRCGAKGEMGEGEGGKEERLSFAHR